MDVLVILWSASVFAAVSFFVAGLATHAAVLRRRAVTGAEPSGAVDEARAREHQARTRAAELEATLARVHEQLRVETGRAHLLSEEVRTLRTSAATLVGLDGELETVRVSLRRSEVELTTLRAASASAESRATAAETKAGAAESRATAAESRVSAAETRMNAAEGRATEAEGHIGTLEARAIAAESRATAAENRATALDKKLAATELELEGMRERVAALGTELAAARPVKPKRPRTTRHAVVADIHGDTVESSLAARLGTFADECGYEVVVLSDAQGLLLAGVGDEQVQGTIAALSSVARELTTRAAEFVELRPKLIEVTDETGRTLRIRLFQWEQEPIALASFGIGHTEPTQEEETVITVFPSLMEAS